MMLKQCSAAILLLSFMAQVLSSPFIVFDYYINTATYATNCINKTKPELHCNGKCQMAKELKQVEDQEQQNPAGEHDYKAPVFLFSKSWFTIVPEGWNTAFESKYAEFQDAGTIDISTPFFHPPTV
ncbi:MAG: hypothetical protein IT250_09025 [Chitinophagaceae bacterium]|nr:hypothetical protein [Chitinophagaceae bacterium]